MATIESKIKPAAALDITNRTCPMTFVVTKLRLEEMQPGEVLEVILTDGEPIHNVPRSVKAEGHRIIAVEPFDGKFRLFIERKL